MRLDKVSKNTKGTFKSDKCKNMLKFEQFVSSLGLSWQFYVDPNTGLLKYRDFTGVEHKLIQEKIKINELIPNHPNLNNILKLWNDFSKLMCIMKDPQPTAVVIEECEHKAREWVTLYGSTYLHKNVTPYMHVMMNHVSEAMSLHGNLNLFSMQSVEVSSDLITKCFFRSTNHHAENAFVQVIQKQNRVECLSNHCNLSKFTVTCQKCSRKGHNKRTCKS